LECKTDDLSAVREDGSKVVERAAHGDQDVGVSLADHFQVARDGSWCDEEDAIGEIFGGEQGPLAQGLLAKVKDSRLAKAGRAVLLKQKVINLAAMQGQADGLLLAVRDGLTGRLVRGDGDEGDLSRGRLGALRGEKRKVDFFDNLENSFSLKGGTVKSLLLPSRVSEPFASVLREPLWWLSIRSCFSHRRSKSVLFSVLFLREAARTTVLFFVLFAREAARTTVLFVVSFRRNAP
jgi:hypothetical protein